MLPGVVGAEAWTGFPLLTVCFPSCTSECTHRMDKNHSSNNIHHFDSFPCFPADIHLTPDAGPCGGRALFMWRGGGCRHREACAVSRCSPKPRPTPKSCIAGSPPLLSLLLACSSRSPCARASPPCACCLLPAFCSGSDRP